MAKIAKKQKEDRFEPYSIVVETKAEHEFLVGLFRGFVDEPKDICDGFDTELDGMFEKLLSNLDK